MRIFITWLCLVSVCCAGWDTNIWPSYIVQRKGRAQAQEAYEAVRERCYAAFIAPPSAPTWWRVQRANLSQCKTALWTLLDPWGYPLPSKQRFVKLDDTNPTNLASYFASNYPPTLVELDEYPDTDYYFPRFMTEYSRTNFYIYASLPTNYFQYTPWRCLNENGPFHDDTNVVGRGHGWTNATTAAGGTNFPAGRTNGWYTTDYGWDGIRKVCDLLMVTQQGFDWSQYGDGSSWTSFSRRYGASGAGANWGTLKAYVEARWTNPEDYFFCTVKGPQGYSEGDYIGGGWVAALSHSMAVVQPSKTTNVAADLEVWVQIGPSHTNRTSGEIGYPEWGANPVSTFADNGDGFTDGWNVYEYYATTNSATWTNMFGTTNFTVKPTWCSEPVVSNMSATGYRSYYRTYLWHWEFSYTNAP